MLPGDRREHRTSCPRNPGLQPMKGRMNMAKRNLKKLLAMALAICVTTSTVNAVAFAVDYDAANGTVMVEDNGSGVQSWQGDGASSSDTTINITGSTDQQVVNVGAGVGSDVTINVDNVTADVTNGDSAIVANGGSVNITDSNLSGGSSDNAAVEIGGSADVSISGETAISGKGTGVAVNGGSLTVESGAEVAISGNKTTVTGGANDVSGTGLDINGGSVTVEDGAYAEITGSDVTVNGEGGTAVITGAGTGVDVSGGELNVEGEIDTQGSAVVAPPENKTSFTIDLTGSTGTAATGGTIHIAPGGEYLTDDYTVSNDSKGYYLYTYTKNSAGKWIAYKDTYVKKESAVKRDDGKYYYPVKDSNGIIIDYVLVKDAVSYTQSKKWVPAATMKKKGTGTGLDLGGDASLLISGDLMATATGTPINIREAVSVKVGPDGRLVTTYINKEGGTIENSGLIFVKNAAEGLREAIDNSGTGLRFVSFDKVVFETNQFGSATKFSNVLHVYWNIGEDEDAVELKVPLKEMIVAASDALTSLNYKQFMGAVVQPGNHFNFDIVVTNDSGYTYTYKADSLVVDVADVVKHAAENGDLYYLNSRVADGAIQALYGAASSDKVTVEQLLAVEKTLRTTGYKGQTFDSIEDYYLFYIEEQTGNKYSSLMDVPYEDFNIALKYDQISFQNSTFYVTDEEYQDLLERVDSDYSEREYELYDTGRRDQYNNKVIQIKETGSADAQLVYRYKYCLVYGFGDTVTNKDANIQKPPYSTTLPNLLDYAADNQLWLDSNAYFESLANDDLAQTGSMNIQIYLLLDGPLTGNRFENTGLSLENYIILTRPADPDNPGGGDMIITDVPYTQFTLKGFTPKVINDGDLNDDEELIPDEDVPLAAVPATGDTALLWMVMSVLSGAAMLALKRKRRVEE